MVAVGLFLSVNFEKERWFWPFCVTLGDIKIIHISLFFGELSKFDKISSDHLGEYASSCSSVIIWATGVSPGKCSSKHLSSLGKPLGGSLLGPLLLFFDNILQILKKKRETLYFSGQSFFHKVISLNSTGFPRTMSCQSISLEVGGSKYRLVTHKLGFVSDSKGNLGQNSTLSYFIPLIEIWKVKTTAIKQSC